MNKTISQLFLANQLHLSPFIIGNVESSFKSYSFVSLKFHHFFSSFFSSFSSNNIISLSSSQFTHFLSHPLYSNSNSNSYSNKKLDKLILDRVLYNQTSDIAISNNIFKFIHSNNDIGGALYLSSGKSGSIQVFDNKFISCCTQERGGVIFAQSTSIVLKSNCFLNNSGGSTGICIYAESPLFESFFNNFYQSRPYSKIPTDSDTISLIINEYSIIHNSNFTQNTPSRGGSGFGYMTGYSINCSYCHFEQNEGFYIISLLFQRAHSIVTQCNFIKNKPKRHPHQLIYFFEASTISYCFFVQNEGEITLSNKPIRILHCTSDKWIQFPDAIIVENSYYLKNHFSLIPIMPLNSNPCHALFTTKYPFLQYPIIVSLGITIPFLIFSFNAFRSCEIPTRRNIAKVRARMGSIRLN